MKITKSTKEVFEINGQLFDDVVKARKYGLEYLRTEYLEENGDELEDLYDDLAELFGASSPDPEPFKLEYGKTYKNRRGDVFGPLKLNTDRCPTFPFECDGECWTPDGSYYADGSDDMDLIEEVV